MVFAWQGEMIWIKTWWITETVNQVIIWPHSLGSYEKKEPVPMKMMQSRQPRENRRVSTVCEFVLTQTCREWSTFISRDPCQLADSCHSNKSRHETAVEWLREHRDADLNRLHFIFKKNRCDDSLRERFEWAGLYMKRQIVLESRSDSYPNGHFPSRCICLWFLDLSPISSLNGTQWNLIVYVYR